MTPQTLGETLGRQYGYTSNTFSANLKDLTDEDGLKQPGTDGNCLNWVAMDQPAPYSPSGNPNETTGSLIAGLLFHESYHIGQLGILRWLAGSEGAIR